jgi:hypothetical protein
MDEHAPMVAAIALQIVQLVVPGGYPDRPFHRLFRWMRYLIAASVSRFPGIAAGLSLEKFR